MFSSEEIKNKYQEIVVKLISAEKYVSLSFYGFILSKLKVHFDPKFPTLGVSFDEESLTYNLIVGSYFNTLQEEEQVAVLIHECRHIIGLHVKRQENRDHKLFNIAADISINQLINNLPEGAQLPKTYDFPKNESAETYYELLKQEQQQQKEDKDESESQGEEWGGPDNNSEGIPKPDLTNLDDEPQTIDVHDWNNSLDNNIEDLQKSIVEQMVKESVEQSRGNVPGDLSEILDLLRRKPKISWTKELRKILSSRRGSRIETFKKPNRRFPNRKDLRGKKVQRDKPVVVVGVDTSGSMSDDMVISGLVEINEVIKNVGELKIIQIDTEIKKVENFDKKNFKRFHRHGFGGTYMGACPEYIKENKIACDVLIMISDMYIEDVTSDKNWKDFKKPVLWLSTDNLPEVLKSHKIFNIKNV